MYHARGKGRLDFRNLQTILVKIERFIILNNANLCSILSTAKKKTSSFVVWFESFLPSKLHKIKQKHTHTLQDEKCHRRKKVSPLHSTSHTHQFFLFCDKQKKTNSSWMKITNLSSIKTQLNSVIAFKRIIVNQLDHTLTHATSVGVNNNNN